MKPFKAKTTSEQLAAHLRQEIYRGAVGGTMPGSKQLVRSLGVNSYAVEEALRILEGEGLLVSQGCRKPRRIQLPAHGTQSRLLRIQFLLYDKMDKQAPHILEMQNRLEAAGFSVGYAIKSQSELDYSIKRISRMVIANQADAWIVVGGSREVLEWFCGQDFPAFGLFGFIREFPIAGTGPLSTSAIIQAVDRLHELGHRRIVMLSSQVLLTPKPGRTDQAFLDHMESLGIPTGKYNLPEWDINRWGVCRSLNPLFQTTPPTALMVDMPQSYHAIRDYLARRKLDIPGDISLICQEPDPVFSFYEPPVSHFDYPIDRWVRRVVQWARNIARGKKDTRQSFSEALFVEGGTIGPAPKSARGRKW